MLKSATFILVAIMGTAGLTTGSFAAPNCPGGTLKGTITCTGPLLHPTCTEGPPWTCVLDKAHDPAKAALEGYDSGSNYGHRRFHTVGLSSFGGNLSVSGGAGPSRHTGPGVFEFGTLHRAQFR